MTSAVRWAEVRRAIATFVWYLEPAILSTGRIPPFDQVVSDFPAQLNGIGSELTGFPSAAGSLSG